MSNVRNPKNKKLQDFKVLNFDVYGTLIVSTKARTGQVAECV
jgi:2-haloacid dehalogenase